jgi:hypothetical protein
VWNRLAEALARRALIAEALTWRERLRLIRHSVTAIGHARDGDFVRIAGRPVAREIITSPLSGTRCVARRAVVEQGMLVGPSAIEGHLTGRYGRYEWLRWPDEAEPKDVLVQDATGVARCRIADARLRYLKPVHWAFGRTPGQSERFTGPPESTRGFEVVVTEAAQVTILGVARWEISAEQQNSYRGTPRSLVIEPPAQRSVEVWIL